MSDLARELRAVRRDLKILTVSADCNGQFYIRGSLNRTPFMFLADTGATSTIVMSKFHARLIGIDLKRLKFDRQANTANGIVATAKTRIARAEIGAFVLMRPTVCVDDGTLEDPLLGMGFLRRMTVTIKKGFLTLKG